MSPGRSPACEIASTGVCALGPFCDEHLVFSAAIAPFPRTPLMRPCMVVPDGIQRFKAPKGSMAIPALQWHSFYLVKNWTCDKSPYVRHRL